MTVIVETGTMVVPGDVIYSTFLRQLHKHKYNNNINAELNDDSNDVIPALGCYVRITADGKTNSNETITNSNNTCEVGSVAMYNIIASRSGVVQWEGSFVYVYPRSAVRLSESKNDSSTSQDILYLAQMKDNTSHKIDVNNTAINSNNNNMYNALGPQPNDIVHLRITRLAHQFAFGEIIAINGRWSSHRVNASSGAASLPGVGASILNNEAAFKGVIRTEDIRPFKPSKDQLMPHPPSLSFQPGDVVMAEVLSQSDVRQYQLSTIKPFCGVVEAHATNDGSVLEHIPRRRDAMVSVHDYSVHPRWCPLIK